MRPSGRLAAGLREGGRVWIGGTEPVAAPADVAELIYMELLELSASMVKLISTLFLLNAPNLEKRLH